MSGTVFHGAVDAHNIVSSAAVDGGNVHNHFHPPQSNWQPRSYIPIPRNEGIVIRSDLVDQLEHLLPGTSEGKSAALWGLGGSGKTQLALEYAYRRSLDRPCSVLWVHAESLATFTQDYRVIAATLGLAVEKLSDEHLLLTVRTAIQNQKQWLLVIDNADHLDLFGVSSSQSNTVHTTRGSSLGQSTEQTAAGNSRSGIDELPTKPMDLPNLKKWLPTGPAGTILWTTRDENILVNLVDAERGIQVERMGEEEAEILLRRAQGRSASSRNTSEDVTILLQELEWLPLAIYQAASFMRETDTSTSDFLVDIRDRSQRMQILSKTQHDRHSPDGKSNSILATWDISINHLQTKEPVSYKILHIIAFIDSQKIPQDLLDTAAVYSEDNQESPPKNKAAIRRGVKRLIDFSFLTKRDTVGSETYYDMHKLVQEAVRYRLNNLSERSIEISSGGQPKDSISRQEPSADETIQWIVEYEQTAPKESAPHPQCPESPVNMKYFHRATLSILESLFPSNSRDPSTWKKCEKYITHAMQATEHIVFDGTTRWLPQCMQKYLEVRGKWRHVSLVTSWVLQNEQKEHEEITPWRLWWLQKLVYEYHRSNNPAGTENLARYILKESQNLLGAQHPFILERKAELAYFLYCSGQYDESEKLAEETIQITATLSSDIRVADLVSRRTLSRIYLKSRRFQEFETMYPLLLQSTHDCHGQEDTISIDHETILADFHIEKGEYTEAEGILLRIRNRQRDLALVGEENAVYTIFCDIRLADVWYDQRKIASAIDLLEDVMRRSRSIMLYDVVVASCEERVAQWRRESGPT